MLLALNPKRSMKTAITSFSLRLFPVLVLVGLLSSCKVNQQKHLLQATLWYQNSAEYRALSFQTFALAQEKLDRTLKSVRFAKPPCIVLDIDETLLDNSPYAGYQIKEDKDFSSEDWKAWTDLATADSIPGSVSFLKWANSANLEIFYVSNRKVAELDATIKNMQALGFPQADKAHVHLRSETSNKEPRREMVRETNSIVMLFGDNLNDFTDYFEGKTSAEREALVNKNRHEFGSTFIILPNPGYGSWQSAMFNYKRGLSYKEKNAIRMQKLKGFPRN